MRTFKSVDETLLFDFQMEANELKWLIFIKLCKVVLPFKPVNNFLVLTIQRQQMGSTFMWYCLSLCTRWY